MRNIERGEAALEPGLVRILQAGEAAQPSDVIVCIGRIVNRFRPRVGHQELQAVGVPLLREQLQPVIDGIGNHLGFGGNSRELWVGKQQLLIRNLREAGSDVAVGVVNECGEGIVH